MAEWKINGLWREVSGVVDFFCKQVQVDIVDVTMVLGILFGAANISAWVTHNYSLVLAYLLYYNNLCVYISF